MMDKMNNTTVLVVDDDEDIRLALSLLLQQAGYQVLEANGGFQCQQLLERRKPDLILLDMNFSRDTTSGQEGLDLLEQIVTTNVPIILMTAWSNIELVVKGIRLGAVDFIEKPWQKTILLNKIAEHISKHNKTANSGLAPWVAVSDVMVNLEQRIEQYAATNASILILGENGTGKSLLAKRIHTLSQRQSGPFIALNMAAIPATLFESELFGHRRGAFTDAKEHRAGAFSRAAQGTLFMDEIGSLPLELQPKLLQVLETGEFVALGASHSEMANVRLIAATNQVLSSAIEQGEFRQDLYYRLNTFVVTIPALRERKQDIPLLVEQFIKQNADKYNKAVSGIAAEAMDKLLAFDWPGNVRELSHVIERTVLIAQRQQLSSEDIILEQQSSTATSLSGLTLAQLEKQRISEVLELHQGKVGKAATALGISRHALYRRLEKYQLEYSDV